MGRSIIGNEQGRISIGTWVLLVVVAIAVYLGVMIGPHYIDHYMLKDKVGNLVKMTQTPPDEEIKSELARIVSERSIPIDLEKDLVINRGENKQLSIRADWTVTVEFPGGKTWDLSFTAEAEK